ncbi:MAG: hypothetical protein HOG03_24105 [Desulfobacula sp.]|jgi:DNA-binding transcriptional regulator YiaG|uniref:helix-turn-helix domain-containing protein n=1 Tax=Desulfobacula sp. TaxID=2593537 RepID=UPI001D2D4650|nr:hypothetical protein [Desulfobacula sp.]MBT6338805.1 hypothetical protein [Desulfobacula sp.]MBT7631287.1 hypothetical protein [Desulfobacula sp.]
MKPSKIKQARLTLGFTQQKISGIMGIHIKLWQKWEQGSQGISAAPAMFLRLILVLAKMGILEKCLKRIENDNTKKL